LGLQVACELARKPTYLLNFHGRSHWPTMPYITRNPRPVQSRTMPPILCAYAPRYLLPEAPRIYCW